MSHEDILRRVASANPVPDPGANMRDEGIAAEATLARILAVPRASATISRRPFGSAGRLRLRSAAILAGVLLAVLVPAIAVATHYGMFDLSNAGQPIDRSGLSLSEASALKRSGFTDDVRRLGERAGVAFYIAPSSSGGLCFATGSAARPAPKLNHFVGCQRPSPDAFPSPQQPILDLSPLKSPNPRESVYVQRLVGFAADGVARVGFVDLAGVVHSTPVVSNIYATDWSSVEVAAKAIVALDSEGRILHTKRLLMPNASG